ncbi:MAG: hypothetical protein HRU17_19360, partial [Polyangiaceae bacterium]|nr:hypothetical protein [Polyangiaceae bacterium]
MTRSTARQWLVLCLLALGLVAVSTGGCSDGECGGVLGENGQCQELCDESECVSGYRCVGNQCRMPCSFDGECYAGQACTSANTDNGQPGKYCIGESPSMGMDVGFLRDDSCSISTDCNQALHLRCVDQICDIACETHADCSSLGVCTATNQDVEGNTLGACEADGFPRAPGQYGSQCVFESCDNEAGFGCFGARAGDLDSYCTQFDCQSDLECPAGFECTLTHDGRPPCSSDICSFPGDPEHPNCVPDDRIGDGQDYQCGPMLLHFSVCVQRDFCSPCESDNDCLAVP